MQCNFLTILYTIHCKRCFNVLEKPLFLELLIAHLNFHKIGIKMVIIVFLLTMNADERAGFM